MTGQRKPRHIHQVYLWTLEKGQEHDQLKPYAEESKIKLPKPMVLNEFSDYVTSIADKQAANIYLFFTFRHMGPKWRVYRTNEDESEHDILFSI